MLSICLKIIVEYTMLSVKKLYTVKLIEMNVLAAESKGTSNNGTVCAGSFHVS